MTAEEVIAIAAKERDTTEYPPGSNKTKYNNYGSGSWCLAFVNWVFNLAGIELPIKTNSCTSFVAAIKNSPQCVYYKNNSFTSDSSNIPFQPGDIIFYQHFDSKEAKFDSDHVGICVSFDPDKDSGTITCWEGNTSAPGSGGSEDNGGGVYLKTRTNVFTGFKGFSDGCVLCAYRPQYDPDKALIFKDYNSNILYAIPYRDDAESTIYRVLLVNYKNTSDLLKTAYELRFYTQNESLYTPIDDLTVDLTNSGYDFLYWNISDSADVPSNPPDDFLSIIYTYTNDTESPETLPWASEMDSLALSIELTKDTLIIKYLVYKPLQISIGEKLANIVIPVGSDWEEIGTSTTTSFTDPDMVSGNFYSYAVCGVNTTNTSIVGNYFFDTRTYCWLDKPTGLTATLQSDGTILLTWNTVANADIYFVYINDTLTFATTVKYYLDLTTHAKGDIITYSVLPSYYACYYASQTFKLNSYITGGIKGTVSITATKAFTCNIPVLGLVGTLGSNNARLSWIPASISNSEVSSTTTVAQRVFYRVSGGSWTGDNSITLSNNTTKEYSIPSSSTTISSFTSGTTYNITVRGLHDASTWTTYYQGWTDKVPNSRMIYYMYLSTPHLTDITIDKNTSAITFSWNAVTGATGYLVYYKSDNTSGWITIGSTTNTSFVDTCAPYLGAGTYTYTVRAISKLGLSSFETTGISITLTESLIKSNAPIITDFNRPNSGAGMTITWSGISEAKLYRIYRKVVRSHWGKESTNTNGLSTVGMQAVGYDDTNALKIIGNDLDNIEHTVEKVIYVNNAGNEIQVSKRLATLDENAWGLYTNIVAAPITLPNPYNFDAAGTNLNLDFSVECSCAFAAYPCIILSNLTELTYGSWEFGINKNKLFYFSNYLNNDNIVTVTWDTWLSLIPNFILDDYPLFFSKLYLYGGDNGIAVLDNENTSEVWTEDLILTTYDLDILSDIAYMDKYWYNITLRRLVDSKNKTRLLLIVNDINLGAKEVDLSYPFESNS